ncbi:MAG: TRAP transporter substrate-binding protein DctP [Nitrospinales bacterium]
MNNIPKLKSTIALMKPFAIKFLQGFIILAILFGTTQSFAGKTHIKFATLAPEGSSWMKQMREFSKQLSKQTNGEVALKFYPGGVSGDEKDVIRKMRIGQLHGAGFTGVGLGEILPEVRVLDLPFLFNTDAEVEHVYKKMNGYFAKRFEEKGYVLIGWVPVGWIHFFSKYKISSVEDLRQTKAWMWEGDPLVKATYKSLKISPHPLSITDVLMSLQTGMIDTVYASSMGALALQWFTKVKYISQLRMGYATGGVLIRKKKFDRLPKNHQATIKSLGEKYMNKLVKKIQEDNDKAMGVMRKNGLNTAEIPSPDRMKNFHDAGKKVRKNLTGKVYSKELLRKVLSHLEEAKN